MFKGSAPVFLTAPQEVVLKKYNKEVVAETKQMRKRIKYLHLNFEIPEDQRQEIVNVCRHCSARLYLEGKSLLESPAASQLQAASASASSSRPSPATEPATKRARLTQETVEQLKEAKGLLDLGVFTQAEFELLKSKLLAAV